MFGLVLSMTVWGTLGCFVLWSGLSTMQVAFFRCAVGFVLLFFYCWHKGYLTKHFLSKKNVLLCAIGGVFIVLNWLLLFQSFKWASITLGNVSYYLQPVLLVSLGRLFFHEHVSLEKTFYIGLTVLGVLLTVDLTPQTLQLDHLKVLGVLCALGAGLFYAFATLIAKYLQALPAALMTTIQMATGLVLLLPFVNLHTLHYDAHTISYALLLGGVHTALAFFLYYRAVQTVSVSTVAVLSYIDPVVAVLTDVAFFHQHLNWVQLLGITLTFLGSYLVVQCKSTQAVIMETV